MSRVLTRRALPSGHLVVVQMSEIADGNLAVDDPDGFLKERRCTLTDTAGGDSAWTWLNQIHGVSVVTVEEPGGAAGSEADAAVTRQPGCVLSVQVADCAPVALIADRGGLAVVHAGWRGLAAGVLEKASEELRSLVGGPQRALVGPCIHSCCYEFGGDDLAAMARELGTEVTAVTRAGLPSLDLPAGVVASLERAGVNDFEIDGACTSCDVRYWSYRATGSGKRQAMLAVIAEGTGPDAA
ncbi:MAG: copper oxidase [Actinobacteria bacterium]|jgi:hypothetical protein|nr:copper oxidase [Actinomycetota bacterium]MDP6061635.1 polyphenol oxidase family protein [Acidimicrobiales bacterium]HJO98560.1 polyphenol oxidase family protein [Acidimicrobiales bacterium]|tara:strand:+ start:30914 stop:31636 length:723 start_codon:yes stop_codon:yes gene_type:complete